MVQRLIAMESPSPCAEQDHGLGLAPRKNTNLQSIGTAVRTMLQAMARADTETILRTAYRTEFQIMNHYSGSHSAQHRGTIPEAHHLAR